jgi:hypothetical protein
LALLFFNIGVEAGQVAFILTLGIVIGLVNWLQKSLVKPLEITAAYALGGIALYWFTERLPSLFLV